MRPPYSPHERARITPLINASHTLHTRARTPCSSIIRAYPLCSTRTRDPHLSSSGSPRLGLDETTPPLVVHTRERIVSPPSTNSSNTLARVSPYPRATLRQELSRRLSDRLTNREISSTSTSHRACTHTSTTISHLVCGAIPLPALPICNPQRVARHPTHTTTRPTPIALRYQAQSPRMTTSDRAFSHR